MRKQILFLVLFLCSSTAAAQSVDPPFSPVPKVVDHVVRMMTKDGSRSTVLRTVTHHRDWTRVVEEGRASTTYFNAAVPTSVTVRRDPDITYLEILRGRERQSSVDGMIPSSRPKNGKRSLVKHATFGMSADLAIPI
jgi:hypothetical protein